MNISEDKVRLAVKGVTIALAIASAATLIALAIMYETVRNGGSDRASILFFGVGVGVGIVMATPWPAIWPLKAAFGVLVFFADPRACLIVGATAATTMLHAKIHVPENAEKK